ncbi:MAG: SRPBCC family protein [Bacteroidetes bacterium]|nr:SRPBCC family protein [Bacteroidales bacterium]NJO68165.1 SRPBCC family protein [Bacteroidota bacterium]
MNFLEFEQELPVSIDSAWSFFSDPRNLKEITPPSMNFRIMNKLPKSIYEGMFIEYRVAPLLGIEMDWVTEITHVREPYFFIDEQRVGPYQIWHHEHHFEEQRKGVKMTDKLYYSLPFGPLGNMIHSLVVQKKILEIFEFRRQKMEILFGS